MNDHEDDRDLDPSIIRGIEEGSADGSSQPPGNGFTEMVVGGIYGLLFAALLIGVFILGHLYGQDVLDLWNG